jgi:predicted transcriptional regulator
MTDGPQQPTPTQWKVLRAVSDLGPCSASEVLQQFESTEGWSVSTVKILLRRLTHKGLLRTRRAGNAFLYTSTPTAAEP